MGIDILRIDILRIDILGIDILGIDILRIDILGIDILGTDNLALPHFIYIPESFPRNSVHFDISENTVCICTVQEI